MPEPLTPDRIREALLLLQARDELERAGAAIKLYTHSPVLLPAYRSLDTEALTGLLDALGTSPWEWPSEDELRVFRTQFSADEDDVLRVLAGFFAAEPLMVLGLLAKLGGGS